MLKSLFCCAYNTNAQCCVLNFHRKENIVKPRISQSTVYSVCFLCILRERELFSNKNILTPKYYCFTTINDETDIHSLTSNVLSKLMITKTIPTIIIYSVWKNLSFVCLQLWLSSVVGFFLLKVLPWCCS